MKKVIKRELEVMFDKDAQPIGFRIAKWTAYIGLACLPRGRRWFWAWVVGLPGAGVIMHFIYRWKTKGWIQSWGGWKYKGLRLAVCSGHQVEQHRIVEEEWDGRECIS